MTLAKAAQRCAGFIKEAKSIVALTGAGISTNAGIPDFRGPKGLYVTKQYDADKIFDIEHFLEDPLPFFEFARDFLSLEQKLKPTHAHLFLSKLEREGKLKGLVTQNIDSLHQTAGSKNVYEMHGSFWESYCLNCFQRFPYEKLKEKLFKEKIPLCKCGGVIKPDVVFFGENVKFLSESSRLAETADLFFVIGTSCVVYPAAMLPKLTSGKIIVVNIDKVNTHSDNVVVEVQDDIDQFFQQVQAFI
ncbi:MAG: RNA polymerase subunit sigma [Omnitrophica WOR_2 bacterium GWA2_47_8]|nr:MAG: RNA polymerase subunit sigma [Omnitrophica WOR_2 bacterium GWA2_47_8]